MFNNETVNFLKLMNKITNAIILTYPVTTGKTESSDIAYMFDLSKFDTDGFDGSLGFFNLSSFLSAFSLFGEDRDVKLENNIIKISDKNTSVGYLTSSQEVLQQYSFKKEQFDKNSEHPVVLEMKLTSDDINKIKCSSNVFSELDHLIISCDDETVLSLGTINNFKQSSNYFKIKKQEVSTKNFTIGLALDIIAKIPQIDYNLKVIYNEERDAYRIILNTETFSLVMSGKNKETTS